MPMAVVSPGDVIRSTDHNSIVNALSGDAGETLTAFYKGADLASTAALTIPDTGNSFDVTGTTNITSLSSLPAGTVIKLQFDGALTLVHNATSLILSGGVSYLTAAGDIFEFISEGSGNWRETHRSLSAITTTVASTFGATPSLAFSTTNAAGSGTGFLRRNATIALYDTTVARALAFGDVGTVGSSGGFASHVLHGHPMPGFASPNLVLSTTNAEGNATTPIRSNAQIAFFDTTAPTTVTFGDVGSAGSVAFAARRDHGHPFASGAAIVASVNNFLGVGSTNGQLQWVPAVTPTGTETLTNKTLTAPTIADFTNAQHDHGDADDGGAILTITNVQTFTSGTSNWTKPAGSPRLVKVILFGGGGGGGGGRGDGAGTFRLGGGAGGGGARVERTYDPSALGATESVTVGAGGAGGAGGSSGAGSAGGVGGNTTFGTHLTAFGGGAGGVGTPGSGGGASSAGANNSAGGEPAGGAVGNPPSSAVSEGGGGVSNAYGGIGGASVHGGGAGGYGGYLQTGGAGGRSLMGGSGGGGGGGLDTTDIETAGGAGGGFNGYGSGGGGAGGAVNGGAGGNGTSRSLTAKSGDGGGGGGAQDSGTAGAGGTGGAPGGGGGGGGAGTTVGGAGGAGGAGECLVYTFY